MDPTLDFAPGPVSFYLRAFEKPQENEVFKDIDVI